MAFKVGKPVKQDTAQKQLTQLRKGKGGRTSKYEPIGREVKKLKKGEILPVEDLAKNEVGGLRGYIRRHFGEDYQVTSSRQDDGEHYTAFISGPGVEL